MSLRHCFWHSGLYGDVAITDQWIPQMQLTAAFCWDDLHEYDDDIIDVAEDKGLLCRVSFKKAIDEFI